jgi:DNA-binding transcriptional ArsR family regulator
MESEQAILALAALAQPTRLDVFRLLVKHEPEGLAAGDIAKALAVPQNTMSSHLAILSRAGAGDGAAFQPIDRLPRRSRRFSRGHAVHGQGLLRRAAGNLRAV